MNADLKDQLQSLSIHKDSPPTGSRPSRPHRTGMIALLVFAAVIGCGAAAFLFRDRWLASSTPKPDPTILSSVQTTSSLTSPSKSMLTATGKIVSDHQVEVSTKVSGQIVALYFEQGDRVEQGQLLAKIEDVNYRARRDEAIAILERSKANSDYHKINYERVANLYRDAKVSAIELAEAKRATEESAATVDAAAAALEYAQKALDDCLVLAPISGIVLERSVEVGDFVAAEAGHGANANAQFAVIADMGKLRVEIDVSELDIARLRKDMPCTITPDAYKDRSYKGHVMWIDPGANYSKATVQVKVRIDDPDDYLRVQGSAQVVFQNSNSSTDTPVPADHSNETHP